MATDPANRPEYNRKEYLFGCRICKSVFETRWEHGRHVSTHRSKCKRCQAKFQDRAKLKEHEPYCKFRNGLIQFSLPKQNNRAKEPKRPFKCILCYRTYTEHQHMLNHQTKRCKKRYRTTEWVVRL